MKRKRENEIETKIIPLRKKRNVILVDRLSSELDGKKWEFSEKKNIKKLENTLDGKKWTDFGPQRKSVRNSQNSKKEMLSFFLKIEKKIKSHKYILYRDIFQFSEKHNMECKYLVRKIKEEFQKKKIILEKSNFSKVQPQTLIKRKKNPNIIKKKIKYKKEYFFSEKSEISNCIKELERESFEKELSTNINKQKERMKKQEKSKLIKQKRESEKNKKLVVQLNNTIKVKNKKIKSFYDKSRYYKNRREELLKKISSIKNFSLSDESILVAFMAGTPSNHVSVMIKEILEKEISSLVKEKVNVNIFKKKGSKQTMQILREQFSIVMNKVKKFLHGSVVFVHTDIGSVRLVKKLSIVLDVPVKINGSFDLIEIPLNPITIENKSLVTILKYVYNFCISEYSVIPWIFFNDRGSERTYVERISLLCNFNFPNFPCQCHDIHTCWMKSCKDNLEVDLIDKEKNRSHSNLKVLFYDDLKKLTKYLNYRNGFIKQYVSKTYKSIIEALETRWGTTIIGSISLLSQYYDIDLVFKQDKLDRQSEYYELFKDKEFLEEVLCNCASGETVILNIWRSFMKINNFKEVLGNNLRSIFILEYISENSRIYFKKMNEFSYLRQNKSVETITNLLKSFLKYFLEYCVDLVESPVVWITQIESKNFSKGLLKYVTENKNFIQVEKYLGLLEEPLFPIFVEYVNSTKPISDFKLLFEFVKILQTCRPNNKSPEKYFLMYKEFRKRSKFLGDDMINFKILINFIGGTKNLYKIENSFKIDNFIYSDVYKDFVNENEQWDNVEDLLEDYSIPEKSNHFYNLLKSNFNARNQQKREIFNGLLVKINFPGTSQVFDTSSLLNFLKFDYFRPNVKDYYEDIKKVIDNLKKAHVGSNLNILNLINSIFKRKGRKLKKSFYFEDFLDRNGNNIFN